MIIACIIISSLALLASSINLILHFCEKKRDDRRRSAMLDYIQNVADGARISAEEYAEECAAAVFENDIFVKYQNTISALLEQHGSDIESLKSGACPDYEKAMAAANAVNEFNAGISAIMNFDPIASAKARRQSGDKEVS